MNQDQINRHPVPRSKNAATEDPEEKLNNMLMTLPVEVADLILDRLDYNSLLKIIIVLRQILTNKKEVPRIRYLLFRILKKFTTEFQNNNQNLSESHQFTRFQVMGSTYSEEVYRSALQVYGQSPRLYGPDLQFISLQILINILVLEHNVPFLSKEELEALKFSQCLEWLHNNKREIRDYVWKALNFALKERKLVTARFHSGLIRRKINDPIVRFLSRTCAAVTNTSNRPQKLPFSTPKDLEYTEIMLPSMDKDEQDQTLNIFKELSTNKQIPLLCLSPIIRAFGKGSSPYNMYQIKAPSEIIQNRPLSNLQDNSNFIRHFSSFRNNPFVLRKDVDETVRICDKSYLKLATIWSIKQIVRNFARTNIIKVLSRSNPLQHIVKNTIDYQNEITDKLMATNNKSMAEVVEVDHCLRDLLICGIQNLTPQETLDFADKKYLKDNNLQNFSFVPNMLMLPVPETVIEIEDDGPDNDNGEVIDMGDDDEGGDQPEGGGSL